LFPPNIAVLDWLLEQNLDGQTTIADIPCGLGNLLPYLRGLGYERIWGYDNWTQIERERASAFLDYYKMQECLLDLPTILSQEVDIIVSISLPFDWLLPDIQPVVDKAQYLLIDSGYLPEPPIEGFEEAGCYPKLLCVYQRRK